MTRETNTAVNIENANPMTSVTAKPLTGPVPYVKRKNAETIVVTCVSTIVPKARENPWSIAVRTAFPRRSSSRMRSKIRTFESTAMPTVRMRPAMPGRVSVDPKYAMAPSTSTTFIKSAITAFTPDSR